MAVEEKDLEQLRSRAEKLREQIAAEEQKAAENSVQQSRTIEKTQLETEVAMLERRLEEAKAASKVSAAKEAASGPLDQVSEQLEAAVASKGAPVGPVPPPEEAEKDKG